MTALVAWAFAGRAGLLGAIGALTKLSPAMVATLDGWRGLRLAVVWTLAAVAVTLPLVGVDAWRDYLTAIANGYPNCDAAASLACGLAPLGFGVSKAITAAIGVGIGLASLAFRDRLVRLALVTCSMIALTTEFSADGPYVVYVAPLVVAMAARVTSRSSAPARQVVAEPASLSAAQEIQPAA
jgi:hypothetical protein